ncbi:MAG: lantibiotic dehydratase [Actinocatenispora sp.]
MDGSHLAPLPGDGWQAWRWGLLRSAGFGVDGLDLLSAPDCATVADAHLDGDADAGEYRAAFDKAVATIADGIHEVAANPRFRAAVTWQNPGAAGAARSVLRDGPGAARNERRRRREEIIAKYWQRYCGKNDSVGFFGPICWARLDPSAAPVTGAPGADLLRHRVVFFERWALATLAEMFAADPQVRPHLPLALLPHLRLDADLLHLPGRTSVRLPAAEVALLCRSDGRTSAARIAADLVADRATGFQRATDVYVLADLLVERGLLRWGLDLPMNLDAEAALRAALEGIDDQPVRDRARTVLDRLGACRDAVAAADDPDVLSVAIDALEAEFTAATGGPARRRPGQTYAGRTVCHLEAVRDLDMTFGGAVLDKLGALEPLLHSARWLTAAMAERYTGVLDDLYDDLVAERGDASVPFDQLWFLALGPLLGAERPTDDVVGDYLTRWTGVLGLGAVEPGATRQRWRTDELLAEVRRAFPADRPGWATARIHTPDVHICATDQAAAARGEFTLVLGELHIGMAGLDTHFFRVGHPRPDELVDAMRRDVPASRIRLAMPDDWPRSSARNADWLHGEHDITMGFAPASGVDTTNLVPASALRVSRIPDAGLVVQAADGRRWPAVEAFADMLTVHAFDTWKLAGTGAHTPRVTVDDMVMLRETWRTTVGATGLADVTGERERFLAVRRFRRDLGLPERVFLRVETEIKPCYVDLASPLYARILCTLLRGAHRKAGPDTPVVITEMLPTAEHAWLTDADGQRYASELRLQVTDPTVAPSA